MELNYFLNVTQKDNSQEYIEKLGDGTLLIYSPTSMKKININNDSIMMVNWHNITKNIDKIEKFINRNKEIKEVVSFGGGSTIDIGKYISYKLNIKFTCIPTMLSTNSYATNKVALLKSKQKNTLEAKMPDKIIVDEELLKLSKNENLYGLADVLSIYTALYDWKIANEDINEEINIGIYKMAENLLLDVLEFIKNNTLDHITQNNMTLFEFIGIAGNITNLYGTGRPESGSEHIMAKEIESKIDIPHGISVALGIIMMSIIQGRKTDEIIDTINKIELLNKKDNYGINKKIIKECLENIKPREGRYTIVDRYVKSNACKDDILKDFFMKVNI